MGAEGRQRACAGRVPSQSDDQEKAGGSTPHARSYFFFFPERMVHNSVTASAPQARFRAHLTHTLATTHSVQCERTDTTETNWLGQDEREAGFYRTKRKDKTHLPTQTCLPLCASSGQRSFPPEEGPQPLASCHQTRKRNKRRSRSKPFTGCGNVLHPTQEEGLSTQLNIYTKLCTMWKEAPSRAVGKGQKNFLNEEDSATAMQRYNNDASVCVSLPKVVPLAALGNTKRLHFGQQPRGGSKQKALKQ